MSDSEDNAPKRLRSSTGGKIAKPAGRASRGEDIGNIQTKLFINGQFVNAISGKTFDVVNPATAQVICQVAEGDKADVDLAVKAARRAFEETWKFVDCSERRDLLLRLADLIEENKEELATLETLDNGKPFSESFNVDLTLTIKCFRYYAGWADKLHGTTCPVDGNFFSIAKREPLGVIAQIIPWNFPLLMAAWKLAPALACGCTIILKPAEQTPLTALRLAELIKKAGFPDGVVNVIPGFGPTAGAALVSHQDVDKIAFTGSTEVGKIIMELAGKSNLKRVSLELGGKSPLIICDDADIDAAVATAQVGIFFNQGQVCTASSRIFVQEGVYDEFVQKFSAAAKKRTQGNGFQDVNMGPQVSQEQFDRILHYIDAGKKEGATVACGGRSVDGPGYFIKPTIFTNVSDDMKIAKEEIFGPVTAVMKFRTLDEAIKRANKSTYGLAAGIFTQNINTALKYASLVKAGTVWINTYNAFDTAQPFGGFKQSGTGRELGEGVLELYTEVKSIMIAVPDRLVKP